MNPTIRKTISKLLAGTLSVVLLAASVSAATWYVEDGDITVSATESGQSVTQKGETHLETTDTVITNRNTEAASSSSITIQSTGDAQAQVTLQDVNLNKDTSDTGAPVEISGSSNVQIDLQGKNQISTANGQAAVHVSEGDLTITSQTSGSLNATADSFDSDGSSGENYESSAAIGSNHGEDMSGSITVEGNAKVKATTANNNDDAENQYAYADAAGIGAGMNGDLTGSIGIGDEAKVTAKSGWDGAGIGAGKNGKMAGSVEIGGSSDVTATSRNDGAGIGAGKYGEMSEDSSITIDGNAVVEATSRDYGAGIGSGRERRMKGAITIEGNAEVEASSGEDGAGIGSGDQGAITSTGSIHIGGNAVVTAVSNDDGAGIGAGEDGDLHGKIHITDHAEVTAKGNDDNAAIGADDLRNGSMILIDGNARVTAIARKSSAIGAGENDRMDEEALIRIGGHAKVTALGGEKVAAIGSSCAVHKYDDEIQSAYFRGTIEILDAANVITGALDSEGNLLRNVPGIIGGGGIADESMEYLNDPDEYGSIVFSNGAVLNGVLCSSYQDVCKWIRVPTENNGLPQGLTFIPYVVSKDAADLSEPSRGMLLYWVTAEGKPLAAESRTENGILTVTVPEKDAVLNTSAGGLELLKAMDVHTLVFKTADRSSTVKLQDLIGLGAASLQITHEGSMASLLADGKEVKDLLS